MLAIVLQRRRQIQLDNGQTPTSLVCACPWAITAKAPGMAKGELLPDTMVIVGRKPPKDHHQDCSPTPAKLANIRSRRAHIKSIPPVVLRTLLPLATANAPVSHFRRVLVSNGWMGRFNAKYLPQLKYRLRAQAKVSKGDDCFMCRLMERLFTCFSFPFCDRRTLAQFWHKKFLSSKLLFLRTI